MTVAGGAGLDTSIDNEDDDGQDATTNMISELVSQGAELNATLEKTGETSLHLAARYARADAAKRLLDMGADVNFQDNTGRTPLHAAVAADAMGAFQVSYYNYYFFKPTTTFFKRRLKHRLTSIKMFVKCSV